MKIETIAGELADGDVFYPWDEPELVCELLVSDSGECQVLIIGSGYALPLPEEGSALVVIHNVKGLRDEPVTATEAPYWQPAHP